MTFSIGTFPSMSSTDFESYWQTLQSSISTLLTLPPGQYPPVSYEQTYSAVYKCVCNGYAEALYARLIGLLTTQLESYAVQLSESTDEKFLASFNSSYEQYKNGLSCIIPIFNYLARFYVAAKLNLELRQELEQLFISIVFNNHLNRLIGLLQSPHIRVSPSTKESLVRLIYERRPDIANQHPSLFRNFIPNLRPLSIEQLPDLQHEAMQMIRDAQEACVECDIENIQRGVKRINANDESGSVETKHVK